LKREERKKGNSLHSFQILFLEKIVARKSEKRDEGWRPPQTCLASEAS